MSRKATTRVGREDRRDEQERASPRRTVSASLTVVKSRDGGAAHADAEDADGEAAPRRREPGGDQRHADRERGAADAEEEPGDDQRRVGAARTASVSTGTMVATLTSGNITRRAEPVGQRAHRDAAERADDDRHRDQQGLLRAKLRPRRSLTPGPSGPSSAHAQKFTANPTVASASITPGLPAEVPVVSVLRPLPTPGRHHPPPAVCSVGWRQLTARSMEKRTGGDQLPTKVPGRRFALPRAAGRVTVGGTCQATPAEPKGRPPPMPDVRAHRVLASISRVAVLEMLREVGGPMGVRELAERMNLHNNTVRKHLDLLVENGFATRLRDGAARRGRPRYVYVASPESSPSEASCATTGCWRRSSRPTCMTPTIRRPRPRRPDGGSVRGRSTAQGTTRGSGPARRPRWSAWCGCSTTSGSSPSWLSGDR